jgi:hypothetical protein
MTGSLVDGCVGVGYCQDVKWVEFTYYKFVLL